MLVVHMNDSQTRQVYNRLRRVFKLSEDVDDNVNLRDVSPHQVSIKLVNSLYRPIQSTVLSIKISLLPENRVILAWHHLYKRAKTRTGRRSLIGASNHNIRETLSKDRQH
jgi:hypothetical protein